MTAIQETGVYIIWHTGYPSRVGVHDWPDSSHESVPIRIARTAGFTPAKTTSLVRQLPERVLICGPPDVARDPDGPGVLCGDAAAESKAAPRLTRIDVFTDPALALLFLCGRGSARGEN